MCIKLSSKQFPVHYLFISSWIFPFFSSTLDLLWESSTTFGRRRCLNYHHSWFQGSSLKFQSYEELARSSRRYRAQAYQVRKAAARTLHGFSKNLHWSIDAIFCAGSTTLGINDVHPTRFAQSQWFWARRYKRYINFHRRGIGRRFHRVAYVWRWINVTCYTNSGTITKCIGRDPAKPSAHTLKRRLNRRLLILEIRTLRSRSRCFPYIFGKVSS